MLKKNFFGASWAVTVGAATPNFKLELGLRGEAHSINFSHPQKFSPPSPEGGKGLSTLITGSGSLCAPTNSNPLDGGPKSI